MSTPKKPKKLKSVRRKLLYCGVCKKSTEFTMQPRKLSDGRRSEGIMWCKKCQFDHAYSHGNVNTLGLIQVKNLIFSKWKSFRFYCEEV